MAQSQKNETAAGLWRKTHTARAEQVGMCFPEQINIWLTLQRGYYLTEISEQEVRGYRRLLVTLRLPFYPLSVSPAATQHLSDS